MRRDLGREIDRYGQFSAKKVSRSIVRLAAGEVKELGKDPQARYAQESVTAPAQNAYRALSNSPLVAGSLSLVRTPDGLQYTSGTDFIEDASGGRFQNLAIPSGTALTATYFYYQSSAGGAMSDAAILAAIERVDGSGSGLDADLLDGQHASSFKPASYVPSWAEISQKPATFPPAPHKSTHAAGGSDALAPADIGAAALDANGHVPLGQLGSGTADSTTYLRGDGTWAKPQGGAATSFAALLKGGI